MKNFQIARAVRYALVTAGAFGTGLHGLASHAQQEMTEIVVTGSRLATSNLESVSPLQIIGADDIDTSGVANVQDVLLKNPAFGTPTFSRTNTNFLVSGTGVATVDLRNLGTARTLVLVDGRRFVAGIPGTQAVDLNSIPAQFIERIDVLTGGASAVYGSDAVAGVVNIIYKKDYEGIDLEYQYGVSAEDDDQQTQISVTMGVNSPDGRGNIMAHIGYTDQGSVFSADRSRSAIDQASRGTFVTGDPSEIFTVQTPFFSSFAPQGRFFAGPTQYTFNANNQLITGFSTNGTATRAPDGFNRSAARTIAVPVERYLFAGRGSYEVADNHTAFFEGTYASAQATSRLEPFPLSSEDIFPGTGGQFPVEFNYEGAIRANPLVPTAVFNSATDTDGDGLQDIFFTRRLSEVGNRGNTVDRDTFRVVGGLEGSLFNDRWNYDVYYSYGQTKENQVSGGQVNVQNFGHALEAVPDVTDLDGDSNTAEAVCRDATARAFGCVPLNLFGFNSASPESIAYVTAPGLLATFVSQKVAGVNLTGEVFDMPAGPVGVAIGGEYRKEFSRAEFNPLQSAGLNAGNAIPREEGEFDVTEFYLETNVPLLADLPMVDKLNLRAAVRLSDYSTVGSTESWNAGLEWSPIPQLRFRGIRAQSTRAPNITELFSPPSETFPPGLIDPCRGVTATSTEPAAAACRAAPGVAANIAANGSFTLNQADLQGIGGFNLGNPLLGEEEGKSLTLGVVITAENIPVLSDFSFTIDYFDIEVADAIVSTPRQFILDQCYTGDPSFCQFITRRPGVTPQNSSGSIEFVDSQVTNGGDLTAEGVDLTVSYAKNLADWGAAGEFRARLSYTHMIDGVVVPFPGSAADPYVGEIGGSEDKAFLALGYNLGNFGATWRATYIGSASLDDQFLVQFESAPGVPLEPESLGIGSWTYHDVHFTYTPTEKTEIFFGADNVFDKEPPPIINGLPGSVTGTETDAGTYDAIGRRYRAGFRVKF